MADPTSAALRRPPLPRSAKKPAFSARPFFTTLLVVCAIAAVSLFLHAPETVALHDASGLGRRGLSAQDEECRLVHHAPDKCAFVRANCPDEEAGVFSYLQLYYCRLPHAKPVGFAILVAWLALLFSTIGIAASDFFCVNLSTISGLLGMSESMAGVTFLAFGNGSPDVFSTFAAMKTNSGSLAVGELIGAAGFITAVVAGSMAIVRPFKVDRRSFVRDVFFFIVAAAFSMVFLIDGKLSLWECATMVGFYIAYVLFVLWWHWWHGRRQRRRFIEATARGHYVTPGGEEAEVFEPYRDEEDASLDGRNQHHSRNTSVDDLRMLEQNNEDDEDLGFEHADEEVRERWLGELNRNMRLSRPRLGERRNTRPPPIRPSLVGALEFRAVLTSLKRSRNIQSMPINLRRYSDDPTFTTAQQQDYMSSASDPAARPPYEVETEGQHDTSPVVVWPNQDVRPGAAPRTRAVSVNDADALRIHQAAFKQHLVRQQDLLGPLDEDNNSLKVPPNNSRRTSDASSRAGQSPIIALSPSPSQEALKGPGPTVHQHRRSLSPDHLAPPEQIFAPGPQSGPHLSATSSTAVSPKHLPKLDIPKTGPANSDVSPFPAYRDYSWSIQSGSRPGSIRLVSPSASPVSLFPNEHFPEIEEEEEKPPAWWPSRFLPTPQRITSKLFPTLCKFSEKSIWGKLLGIVAAPSVFLLTITLPVVEADRDNEDTMPELNLPSPVVRTPASHHRSAPSTITVIAPDDDPPAQEGHSRTYSSETQGVAGHGSTAGVAAAHETQHRAAYHDSSPVVIISPSAGPMHQSPEEYAYRPQTAGSSSEPKPWDRWLIILQAFTAPLFVVVVIWANFELDNPRALVRPVLISLACSLAILLLILSTTTPDRAPKWRISLSFAGFIVAIAWISTIANEVVGVLKALGAILNISDAILGLTIFAVGNSLGDLVADITVARLGFPVMALSACFGGPMLNILLGIGLGGCYMTIKHAENKHEKHPDRPLHFKPYHLDISSSLIVSGATLLVTLLGLLVMVPLRKWRMDRVVGCSLVVLWVVSTIGNVVAELLGWGDDNIN
ncbi:Sodium/calcium exchanger membrane region [Lasiodiplodia theobromae]|nr:Sodium/calcium exchanger membrane region [Lasiodiplodia theobromae]KAB2570320.1 putative cation exchanger [Lasiodiplodia theobromae]KAF4534844.1 Sodium/calcium exchanger membrane region [Lasiodiplodia theobromae]